MAKHKPDRLRFSHMQDAFARRVGYPSLTRAEKDKALRDALRVTPGAYSFLSGVDHDIMDDVRRWNAAYRDGARSFSGIILRQDDEIEWYWDEETKQYRSEDGQFLSRDGALDLALLSILASQNSVSTVASLWSGGAINSITWKAAFKQVVKDEYIRQYLAGIGGRARMTQSDWGRLGAMLKEQYAYIDNFETLLGTMSDAQIEFRMTLYINSAHQANEKAYGVLAKQWGSDSTDWLEDPSADHCATCKRRNDEAPQPAGDNGGYIDPVLGIETWPGAGDSECLTSCRCTIKHINSKTGAVFNAN